MTSKALSRFPIQDLQNIFEMEKNGNLILCTDKLMLSCLNLMVLNSQEL